MSSAVLASGQAHPRIQAKLVGHSDGGVAQRVAMILLATERAELLRLSAQFMAEFATVVAPGWHREPLFRMPGRGLALMHSEAVGEAPRLLAVRR